MEFKSIEEGIQILKDELSWKNKDKMLVR